MDATLDVTFFRRKILVSHYEKIPMGTLWCFKNFLAAETFIGCKVGYHVFSPNYFGLSIPKNSMATLRCFGKVQVAEKVLADSGDITLLSWISLCHSTLNFHWELFVVLEKFWKRNLFLHARWDITLFYRISLVWHYRKISIGTLWCFKNFLVAKKLNERERRLSRSSVEFFLDHSTGKFAAENLGV